MLFRELLGGARLLRVTEIGEHGKREISALSIDPEVYDAVPVKPRSPRTGEPVLSGQPLVAFLDLPLLRGDEPPNAGYVAARQVPWPGGVAIYGSPETTGYALKVLPRLRQPWASRSMTCLRGRGACCMACVSA